MSVRVYVAASSSELDRVRRVMAALREGGCTITCDWPADIDEAHALGYASDADVPDAHARECALADLMGVAICDVFLLLRGEVTSFDAAFEAGFAAGGNIAMRRIVVGSRTPIFLRRWEHFDTDDEAVAAIVGAP